MVKVLTKSRYKITDEIICKFFHEAQVSQAQMHSLVWNSAANANKNLWYNQTAEVLSNPAKTNHPFDTENVFHQVTWLGEIIISVL